MARAKKRKAVSKARRRPAKPLRRTARPKAAVKRGAKPARRTAAKGAGESPAMRALARRIIEGTLANDDEAMLALYASNVESSEAGQPAEVGLDALRAKFAGWRSLTSDTAFEPRRVCVDGNVIMIEWIGRVTLAATGRHAELREVAVHEIENGKIVREAFYYNPAALGLG